MRSRPASPPARAEHGSRLTGWVLLVGDPRGGFDVIGPFPSQAAAEARASRWDDADWWPIELQQRADGEEDARPGT